MSQLKSMLRWEFILEYRYKLIHLAVLSVVLYFVSLKAIPEMDVAEFHTVFLFFDPVLIGIMECISLPMPSPERLMATT